MPRLCVASGVHVVVRVCVLPSFWGVSAGGRSPLFLLWDGGVASLSWHPCLGCPFGAGLFSPPLPRRLSLRVDMAFWRAAPRARVLGTLTRRKGPTRRRRGGGVVGGRSGRFFILVRLGALGVNVAGLVDVLVSAGAFISFRVRFARRLASPSSLSPAELG